MMKLAAHLLLLTGASSFVPNARIHPRFATSLDALGVFVRKAKENDLRKMIEAGKKSTGNFSAFLLLSRS